MKVSVIVPVYNEKNTIEEIISKIKASELDKEIVIVDDGSTDGTADILRSKFSNDKEMNLIFLEKNHGKGFAIRTALEHIKADIVIMQDADLEYNPADYIKLASPIIEGRASVVYGSRFVKLNIFFYVWNWFWSKIRGRECSVGHIYLLNFLCIQILNLLVRILYGVKITDEATCYKAFKADLLKSIKLECVKFEFCPEITAKVCKLGYGIYEVPISYYPRSSKHGKKINWKDGLMAIFTILKYRLKD